jgi:adenosylcobinamide amidohydrolase
LNTSVTPLIDIHRRTRQEDGAHRPLLVWDAGPGWRMASSAVVGGGLGTRAWFLNAQVRPGYGRMDPEAHLLELAAGQGFDGLGVGLMTAAEVEDFVHTADEGVEAVVTAGLGVTGWAAADEPATPGPPRPGTVNILAAIPAALGDAALINCIATATEAKVQALLAAGLDCSGTPSDAICVAAREPLPGHQIELFGGPRSLWGARLARAVYSAVNEAALKQSR